MGSAAAQSLCWADLELTLFALHALLPGGTDAVTGLRVTRVPSTGTHTPAVYTVRPRRTS